MISLFVWICWFSIMYLCPSPLYNIDIYAVYVFIFLGYHKWLFTHYTHLRMASITQTFCRIFLINQMLILKNVFFSFIIFLSWCLWLSLIFILFSFLCKIPTHFHSHREDLPPWGLWAVMILGVFVLNTSFQKLVFLTSISLKQNITQ